MSSSQSFRLTKEICYNHREMSLDHLGRISIGRFIRVKNYVLGALTTHFDFEPLMKFEELSYLPFCNTLSLSFFLSLSLSFFLSLSLSFYLYLQCFCA